MNAETLVHDAVTHDVDAEAGDAAVRLTPRRAEMALRARDAVRRAAADVAAGVAGRIERSADTLQRSDGTGAPRAVRRGRRQDERLACVRDHIEARSEDIAHERSGEHVARAPLPRDDALL